MTRPPAARVAIVDDDEAVRDALSMMLRTAGYAPDTYASATEYLSRKPPPPPACVVLDVRMPGMSGLELQEKLAERESGLPILFLTGHGDVPMAVRAMKQGAFDFIEKPVDSERLLGAVKAAVAYSAQPKPIEAPVGPTPAGLASLSKREREVLDLVLAGHQTRAIAEALFITVKTVEFHRGRIHQKLGVQSMAELFRLCFAREPAGGAGHVAGR
ncbi:MAG TPA: response regulator [Steroidobacteraceae bacterium]|nr:response regulator [Steroidobacteraceae bacterium]